MMSPRDPEPPPSSHRPLRRRSFALPWPLLMRPRSLASSFASHVGVALLAAAATLLLQPGPRPGPAPSGPSSGEVVSTSSPPSEVSVDFRGGVPTLDDPPDIPGFAPGDRMGVVVRHNGRRSDDARLLVRAEPLSGVPVRTGTSSEVYVSLDPRRMAWRGQALHYEGPAGEVLPLHAGLWRLTVMISDPQGCAGPPLHVCTRTDAWLRVL